jgi:hypothetical protein
MTYVGAVPIELELVDPTWAITRLSAQKRDADELAKVERDAERLRRAQAKHRGPLEFEHYFWRCRSSPAIFLGAAQKCC